MLYSICMRGLDMFVIGPWQVMYYIALAGLVFDFLFSASDFTVNISNEMSLVIYIQLYIH